jgi:transposase-like protein
MPKNKYGVKCPKCQSQSVWKVGFVPTAKGRKDRFKCTVCAHTFYKGQPGTTARVSKSRKKKAG